MQSVRKSFADGLDDRDPWTDALSVAFPDVHTIHVSDPLIQSNVRLTKAVVYQSVINGEINCEQADTIVSKLDEVWGA